MTNEKKRRKNIMYIVITNYIAFNLHVQQRKNT